MGADEKQLWCRVSRSDKCQVLRRDPFTLVEAFLERSNKILEKLGGMG
jgi:hypothetical protein